MADWIGGMVKPFSAAVRKLIVEVDTSEVVVEVFCRDLGVSTSQFWELRRQARDDPSVVEGPRSRAPKRVANKTPPEIEDLVVATRVRLVAGGLDAGPDTIQWHLERQNAEVVPSPATIWRILKRHKLVEPQPRKRPRSSWKSFVAERVNELWQADAHEWSLADGTIVDVIDIIDDCSRYGLGSLVVAHGHNSANVLKALSTAGQNHGLPERILSDNGTPFTSAIDALAVYGVRSSRSAPYHPQTCGKVERFHQTLQKRLDAFPPAETIPELQHRIDEFIDIYNNNRPHRSLRRRTPAEVFDTTPRSGATGIPISVGPQTHTGRVTTRGSIWIDSRYEISIGVSYTGTQAITLITNDHARVFIDGVLIRELTINPNRRYQPRHPRPVRPPDPHT